MLLVLGTETNSCLSSMPRTAILTWSHTTHGLWHWVSGGGLELWSRGIQLSFHFWRMCLGPKSRPTYHHPASSQSVCPLEGVQTPVWGPAMLGGNRSLWNSPTQWTKPHCQHWLSMKIQKEWPTRRHPFWLETRYIKYSFVQEQVRGSDFLESSFLFTSQEWSGSQIWYHQSPPRALVLCLPQKKIQNPVPIPLGLEFHMMSVVFCFPKKHYPPNNHEISEAS